MGNQESLPAQEFSAPFRVDKTGLARREEWKRLSQDADYIGTVEANMVQAETAGRIIIASEVATDQVA
jgi:hypothetical protein